ncbi:phosphoribosylglycinamide formyltransferase [Geobacter sulfurreducens]|jgi:phosphoribosylglycinamide formyltransferase-1|uniref:Phosphoribosylglycinamide formyltransferase n=1 Tax=Geobacter sulfurreducens (strain ATCC 51573 / DSM 12127 / PCA) TaxID=243231 RepID=Q74CB5_GEOSL|nr:phosphoribosylglycinamide formyltransferase [Geobacter sulfurreducens]AAR35136.1 phosphoribosylglycinamide formyltransferase, folate-dependent [Geobacter sulfurreducens PCA]ADI84595.1 phosphoribosylglycinamide formyltransferase, folate-dependent [Geobacter sulfurreducens KN400]AJY71234.1 phosphoribosylglycinamide formyltransferase [Geobacter sulfurreducens]UAC02507.1 phosphoribosylglycinamide formyltransferase [Geobacter sulfurreducens]UTG91225.1 phosphoribosylglycinamide formyltransferase 
MIQPLAVGVLVSGNGSNLQAIIDRIEDGSLPARIVCVISNKADAFGLERARKHGVPAIHIDHRAHGGRESYDAALVETLRSHGVQLVVLAGFMRIVTPVLLDAFPNAVMNIHPALLPAFPGLHAQAQALRYGVKFSGCTVHFVDEGTDTGPIIIQAAVPVMDDDDEASLSARIQREEHRAYPEAIRLFAAKRLRIEGRKVSILQGA